MELVGNMKDELVNEIKDFLFSIIKDHLEQRHDEKKILADMKEYIQGQFDFIYKNADWENELDFQGLMQYIEESLLDEVKCYLFSYKTEDSDRYKATILEKVKFYAKATTKRQCQIIGQFVENLLGIASNYYMDKLDGSSKVFLNLTKQDILSSMEKRFNEIKEKLHELPEKTAESLSKQENLLEKTNRIAEKCQEYAKRYEEELPLMNDDSVRVSLKQLYIEPKYSLLYPYESKKEGLVFS